MNALAQIINRIKKNGSTILRRPFLLFLLCALLILGLALSFYYTLGKTNPSTLSLRYQIPQSDKPAPLLRGIGLDLSEVESPNLIENPDFAPYLYKFAVPLTRIEEHSVFSAYNRTESDQFQDHFFNQASVRFLRSKMGMQEELGRGVIEQHLVARLGPGRDIVLAGQSPGEYLDIAWRLQEDGTVRDVLAVGEAGHAIAAFLSNNPAVVDLETQTKLVAAFADNEGYIVLNEFGEIFLSDAEAQNWENLPPQIAESNWRATDVLRVNGKIIISGTLGRILMIDGQDAHILQLATSTKLNALAVHENEVIVAGDFNQVWHADLSGDALDFKRLTLPDYETTKPHWTEVISEHGNLMLTGTKTSLLQGQSLDQLSPINTDFLERAGLSLRVIMLSAEDILLQASNTEVYRSADAGQSFQALETPEDYLGKLHRIGTERLVGIKQRGLLSIYPLEASFAISKEVNALKLEAGDMMYLEQLSYNPNSQAATQVAAWESAKTTQTLLKTGDDSYRFYLSNVDQVAISSLSTPLQKVDAFLLNLHDSSATQHLDSSRLQEGLVYTLAVKAVESKDILNLQNQNPSILRVRLSGPFPEQVLEFVAWQNTPTTQELRFVMPRLTGESTQETLIQLEVEGSLALDHIYFGLDKDLFNSLSNAQNTLIKTAKPDIIRLSGLRIGSAGLATEQWLLNKEAFVSGQSTSSMNLGEAMRLVQSMQAQPWISIDAYSSTLEIQNLITYLAAGIDDPLGQLRLNQGSTTPWTSGFERIYIEFMDDDNVLQTAMDKAAFAETMKSAIENSPQYNQIKHKIIFVDGMEYHGERMLSQADFHSLTFPVTDEMPQETSFAGIRKLYESYQIETPRRMESGNDMPQELIRSLQNSTFVQTLTPAEQLYLLLYDYGEGTALINIDILLGKTPALFELSRFSPDTRRLSLQENQDVSIIAFGDSDKPRIYAWSTSVNKAVIRLETGVSEGLNIRYYDRNLVLQSSGSYPGDDKDITLLPGMLVIVD